MRNFFTELKVKQVSKPIEAKVIQNACADIEGFDQPMLFLLFLRDGVIHQMEGATIDDSTVDIDFSKIIGAPQGQEIPLLGT